MKVLFLNPHLHADHKLVTDLQAKGYAVLLPANAEEAWQMVSLHGSSIDLAVVHREDQGSDSNERGFEFLAKLKSAPAYADIPVLVTSHRWGDHEFAEHQEGPQGANAYLKWPFTASSFISTVDAIYGRSAAAASEPQGGFSLPTADMVLEDVSNLFSGGASAPSNPSFQLEAPEMEIESAPASGGEIELSSFELPEVAESSVALVEVPVSQTAPASESPAASLPEPPSVEELSIQMGEPLTGQLQAAVPADEASDAEAAQEMPYIFGKEQVRGVDPSLIFAQPQGDAVVPGGAAHSPDVETLKKYLLLREQDVAALSSQLRSAREQIHSLEEQLREERSKNAELNHLLNERERKLDEFEKEKQAALDSLGSEAEDLRFQLKTKTDKARILESQVREASDEMGRLKERVRTDIRKIRVREKELENRLELMRKDTDALLASRESKIIELKRKLDLMEFNMDLLQDQHAREKENSNKLRERLSKAAQVVRVAGGLLDSPGGVAQLAAALEEEAS